jgi:hypothetical protein
MKHRRVETKFHFTNWILRMRECPADHLRNFGPRVPSGAFFMTGHTRGRVGNRQKKKELLFRDLWDTSLHSTTHGADVTNNKVALVVFYGLIIASAVIWLSLAAMA